MHNRIGHRFQRRIDVPVWLERGQGLAYADKVREIQPANLIAYWPLWELSGTNAENIEGNAAKDGTYVGNPTLGQPGIGDGRTSVLFDAIDDNVDVYSAALDADFTGAGAAGDEGSVGIWCKVSGAGIWTDGVFRNAVVFSSPGFSSTIFLRRHTINNSMRLVRIGEGVTDGVTIGGLSTTDWFHIGMTWSLAADQMIAYMNGVQSGATQVGLVAWDAAGLLVGNVNIGNALWSGWLQHGPLWNTALTPAEMLEVATV